MTGPGHGAAVGDADYLEIQRFLHFEAALLDGGDYAGWLALLAPDISYRITTRLVRPAHEAVERFTIIDEDAGNLRLRVEQLADPTLTHAENPATMTRRFLSNFQISHAEMAGSYVAVANLLVYRNRANESNAGLLAGERRDVLKRVGDTLRIAERCVHLDESVLREGTLSILL